MSKFRDYTSAFDENRRRCKSDAAIKRYIENELKIDVKDFESYYEFEKRHEYAKLQNAWDKINEGDESTANNFLSQSTRSMMVHAEYEWYAANRPYFNVYPVIEKKFMELNEEIVLSELYLPFKSIEVRTYHRTVLMSEIGNFFFFVVDFPGGSFQEFTVSKSSSPLKLLDSCAYTELNRTWGTKPDLPGSLEDGDRKQIVYMCAGVCLLAKDESVVKPVVLSSDYKEGMSEDDISRYAQKAVNRTGKTGFEVGRTLQRMEATIHYRNGCFAKYYVGPSHKSYPKNADTRLAPIIQWRSGAVVNSKNIPKVPTGFKGLEEACN